MENKNGMWKWVAGVVIGASLPVVSFSIGYGILSQKVDSHDKRLEKLEELNIIVIQLQVRMENEANTHREVLEKLLSQQSEILKEVKKNGTDGPS